VSASRKPQKPQGPVTRVSRIALFGLAAGLLTFMIGTMFMARIMGAASEPLSALSGLSRGLLTWLVLVLPVVAVGASAAYGAGLLIEARPWGFAIAQQLGTLALPVGLWFIVGRSETPLSLARIVASVLALLANTWLCAFAFRRGGLRMRQPSPQPEALPRQDLSHIDFEAIKRAEQAGSSPAQIPPQGDPPPKP
jgi:hypothetical protein